MSLLNFFHSTTAGTSGSGTSGSAISRTQRPTSSLPSDLGDDEPCQPRGTFPNTMFGKRERSFLDRWYHGREWLEYSVQRDAAYCYSCRKFISSTSTGEHTFRLEGFRNWKTALENGRGFSQHQASADHATSISLWKEAQFRKTTHQEVNTLVNSTQLDKNRYYLSCIVDIIKFLSTNELPLRGDQESCGAELDTDSVSSAGLFIKLFEYTLRKDEKLRDVMKSIPKNAKYTSPDIQNETISLLAKMVQETIVQQVRASDVPFFTLKVDGTKDPTGTENISIVVRYVMAGTPIERVVTLATTVDLDAEALATTVLTALQASGLDPKSIISQCYDGASVMSGVHGGLQAKLQQRLSKEIPYIHCYNHQLHLVVVHAISSDIKLQNFFDICGSLYNFTRKPRVAAIYDGAKLKRLLDQRWTGHLRTTAAILDNRDDLLELLRHCADSNASVDNDTSIQAIGLLAKMSNLEFIFIAKCVRCILTILEPANNSLQSKTMDLLTASEVIDCVVDSVSQLRSAEKFEELYSAVFTDSGVESGDASATALQPVQVGSKRRIVASSTLNDFVLTDLMPRRIDTSANQKIELRQLYFGVIDQTVGEIKTRFSANNIALLKSLKALVAFEDFESNASFIKDLGPLGRLCDVDLIQCHEEIIAGMSFVRRKNYENPGCMDNLHKQVLVMLKYRDAFPSLYRLLASALTIGASSSTCEASFSALARVLTPYRRSMLHKRKADLVLLAYEQDITNGIKIEEFLVRFNAAKERKLQLY